MQRIKHILSIYLFTVIYLGCRIRYFCYTLYVQYIRGMSLTYYQKRLTIGFLHVSFFPSLSNATTRHAVAFFFRVYTFAIHELKTEEGIWGASLMDIALRNWTAWKFCVFFWSSTGHSRARNASSASSVKIWQEYASKNIANVCRVSFVFKINFVDSRTQIRSAVRTALRNFLRVQLNWKIAIHVCRGCYSAFYFAFYFRPRKTVLDIPRLVMNCSSLYVCESLAQIGCFVEQYRDPIKTAPISRSGVTSIEPKIRCLFRLFIYLFVCSSPSGTSSL